MQSFALSEKARKLLWGSLLFMLVVRIVASIVVPLTDTTEARYGEIARKMLETGDWITPQHDYGVPFWAKPPLSTWLSAGSMKLFGVSEFAARLPSLLLGIAMLVLVWVWVAPRRGRDFALTASAILASMVLFFMAGGAVMTDSSLAFCTTLTMIAFWQALHAAPGSEQKTWGYLFFVGLGLGLLAKGPLVGVLTFLPILPWVVLRKNWREVWHRLPWIRGSLLMLVIGLPWYAIAEHKTPGFLAYFILGEHFGRFLNAGWTGDKYGHAHAEPLGMIWVFWLGAAFPWSFALLGWLFKQRRSLRRYLHSDDGLISYLLLWAFLAPLFFTFAHNIIWPYVLPALPALAVLIAELWLRSATSSSISDTNAPTVGSGLLALSFATPVAMLALAAIYSSNQQVLLKSSQQATARYYLQARPSPQSGLYYWRRRYYSGEFYSNGKAQVATRENIETLLHNDSIDFLVIQTDDLEKLSAGQRAHFKTAAQFGKFVVLEELSEELPESVSEHNSEPNAAQ